LIVQNEQRRLPAALASVAFCDEIVIVDGGSTDRTIELARVAGAKVIENRWPGFAAQRNVALDAAGGALRIFNPGSPTDRRRQPHGTLGVLNVADGALIEARIVEVT